MRLLTHNALRNNSAAAKGKGFPLRIEATEVRVDDGVEIDERSIFFIRRMLVMLDWPALVQVWAALGFNSRINAERRRV
jgi:multifunctional methyltransferase subunit TRM112